MISPASGKVQMRYGISENEEAEESATQLAISFSFSAKYGILRMDRTGVNLFFNLMLWQNFRVILKYETISKFVTKKLNVTGSTIDWGNFPLLIMHIKMLDVFDEHLEAESLKKSAFSDVVSTDIGRFASRGGSLAPRTYYVHIITSQLFDYDCS